MDYTKLWMYERDTFVLPRNYENFVFIPNPKDPKLLFMLQVALCSKQILEDVDVKEVSSDLDSLMHMFVQEEEIIPREEEAIEEDQMQDELEDNVFHKDY